MFRETLIRRGAGHEEHQASLSHLHRLGNGVWVGCILAIAGAGSDEEIVVVMPRNMAGRPALAAPPRIGQCRLRFPGVAFTFVSRPHRRKVT